MKTWFFVLILLTSSSAYSQEYFRIKRSYVDLSLLSLKGCEETFRVTYRNYMHCEQRFKELLGEPELSTVTLQTLPEKRFDFATDLPEIRMSVEMTSAIQHGGNAPYGDALLLFSMYYYHISQPHMIYLHAPEHYQKSVFLKYLKLSFEELKNAGGWDLEKTIIGHPSKNKGVRDIVIDRVHVVERSIHPDLEDCRKAFVSVLADAWPDDDYWYSRCFVQAPRLVPSAADLPMGPQVWAEELKRHPSSIIFRGETALSAGPSFYQVFMLGKFDWSEAEEEIKKTLAKLRGQVKVQYVVDQRQLGSLSSLDKPVGRLVLSKEGKLDAPYPYCPEEYPDCDL